MMAEPHTHDQRLHLHPVSPDDWESHRDVRLAMLQDAPDAFWFTYADEAAYDEADWRERIEGAWLVQARDASGVLGSAGLGSHWEPERATTATLFGMYVAPEARGRGVGEALVRAVLEHARRLGKSEVVLEVTSPTRRRRPCTRGAGSCAPARSTTTRDGRTCGRSRWSTASESPCRAVGPVVPPNVHRPSGAVRLPVVRRWTHERHHRASPRRGRLGGLPFRPPRRTA